MIVADDKHKGIVVSFHYPPFQNFNFEKSSSFYTKLLNGNEYLSIMV